MKMMGRMRAFKKTAIVGSILWMAAASAAQAATPDILQQIPADANGAVVIGNVRGLSDKISNMITRLNLPLPLPPNLAEFALRNLGITQGFDQNGSAALVILKPANAADGPFGGPPPAVLLLPTSDAKAMLQNFSPSDPDKDGFTELTLPGNTAEKGYSIAVGKWLALAQDKDTLNRYIADKNSLDKAAIEPIKKAFEENDIVLWSNLASVGPSIVKVLEEKQQEVAGMMDLANLNTNLDPTSAALQKQVFLTYFNGIKQLMTDGDQGLITIRLSDAGLTFGGMGTFKPKTPLATFVTAQKPKAAPSFTGLPTGDVNGAMAWNFDGPSFAGVINVIAKQVLSDEVIAKDAKIADFQKFADMYQQLVTGQSGFRGVLITPPEDTIAKNGYLSGAFLVDTGDGARAHDLILQMTKNPISSQAMSGDIKQKLTVAEDAVTIKDVKLTKIHMEWSMREDTADKPLSPGSQQGLAMIHKIYGTDGLTEYLGVINNQLLIVVGSDAKLLESAVAAAQSKSDTLDNDPLISSVKDHIVANTAAVAYLPVNKWLAMASKMAGAAPESAPVNPPPANSPPIVISIGNDGQVLAGEYFVPITAVTAGMDMYRKMQAMHQGAGNQMP